MNLFVQLAYLVLLLVNLQICETYGDVNKEKTEFWEHGAMVQGVVLSGAAVHGVILFGASDRRMTPWIPESVSFRRRVRRRNFA
jgi:hypothetical protein